MSVAATVSYLRVYSKSIAQVKLVRMETQFHISTRYKKTFAVSLGSADSKGE